MENVPYYGLQGNHSWCSNTLEVGAATGGLVSGIFDVYTAFTIDSLTYIASTTFLARVTYHIPHEVKQAQNVSLLRFHEQFLDGLRYLKCYPEILVIALHKSALQFCLSAGFDVVQVQIAQNVFTIGLSGGLTLGLLFTISGIGTGFGPIGARIMTGDQISSLRHAIILGYLLAAIGLAIVSTLHSFPIVLFGGLVRGLGSGIIWVFSAQLLLQLVPTHIRGRVFSFEQAAFALASAISATASGILLDTLSNLSQIIFGMALITLIPGILWALWCYLRPIDESFRAE